MTIPRDGHYYWLWWKHKPGIANEWIPALYLERPGWQLPGELYSVDRLDFRILRVGPEIVPPTGKEMDVLDEGENKA